MPIYPLDGSKFIQCLIEKKYPYEKALKINNIICLITYIVFVIYNVLNIYKNITMCLILLIEIIIIIKNQKYLIERFYLERYLYEYPYYKIENNLECNIHLLKKDTLHFFKKKNYYIHEKKLLKSYFEG